MRCRWNRWRPVVCRSPVRPLPVRWLPRPLFVAPLSRRPPSPDRPPIPLPGNGLSLLTVRLSNLVPPLLHHCATDFEDLTVGRNAAVTRSIPTRRLTPSGLPVRGDLTPVAAAANRPPPSPTGARRRHRPARRAGIPTTPAGAAPETTQARSVHRDMPPSWQEHEGTDSAVAGSRFASLERMCPQNYRCDISISVL